MALRTLLVKKVAPRSYPADMPGEIRIRLAEFRQLRQLWEVLLHRATDQGNQPQQQQARTQFLSYLNHRVHDANGDPSAPQAKAYRPLQQPATRALKTRTQNPRLVEPELLDSLPAADPAAKRSRRDLRLINALMGNQRWIVRQLRKPPPPYPHWHQWELGAGDGSLGARIATEPSLRAIRLSALDFAPRSPAWPTGWDWHQADILATAAERPRADLVIANLILHHFQDAELRQIGNWICDAQVIIAVEPLRARLPHVLAFALRLLGINHVTRKDIHTSIRAGFTGSELPDLLGLDPAAWEIHLSTSLLGAYRLLARRRPTTRSAPAT